MEDHVKFTDHQAVIGRNDNETRSGRVSLHGTFDDGRFRSMKRRSRQPASITTYRRSRATSFSSTYLPISLLNCSMD